jgi:tetratricopeptide (TPR) repeat protein
MTLVFPASVYAESLASKNKEGNRLYSEGKYEEAEKAYLDAQVKSPGKPEILYNLGNSLIKQKEYDRGLQALRQSMGKGNEDVKRNSWFNGGNALFHMGNYKDATESYIQALRLDPSDQDAKHNLEMALRELKQQEQQSSGSDQQQENSRDPNQSSNENKDQQQFNQDSQNSGSQDKPDRTEREQYSEADPRESQMSKEQALQMLDAVQDRELEEQRKLLNQRTRRKSNERDW